MHGFYLTRDSDHDGIERRRRNTRIPAEASSFLSTAFMSWLMQPDAMGNEHSPMTKASKSLDMRPWTWTRRLASHVHSPVPEAVEWRSHFKESGKVAPAGRKL